MAVEISRRDVTCDSLLDLESETRFLKLPVDPYLELLGVTPLESQVAIINAINNPKYRFVCAAVSRRQGKTYIANIIGQLVSLVPNSNILIMSPNYALSQISFDLQRTLIKHFDLAIIPSPAISADWFEEKFDYDGYIFLSIHASESGVLGLTCHITGNFSDANFGGYSRQVSVPHPHIQKSYIQNLWNARGKFPGFQITIEATHHGPTALNKPALFIEIGTCLSLVEYGIYRYPIFYRNGRVCAAQLRTIYPRHPAPYPIPSDGVKR